MTIKVNILYPSLRQFTGNQEVVKANGKTIGECLSHLVKQFPVSRHPFWQGKTGGNVL